MTKKTSADTKPDLRIVESESAVYDLMRAPETTADRVKRLQLEAHALALEEIEDDPEVRMLRVIAGRNCGSTEVALTWVWDRGCFHEETDKCAGCQ